MKKLVLTKEETEFCVAQEYEFGYDVDTVKHQSSHLVEYYGEGYLLDDGWGREDSEHVQFSYRAICKSDDLWFAGCSITDERNSLTCSACYKELKLRMNSNPKFI